VAQANLLSIVIFLPVVGAIAAAFFPAGEPRQHKALALVITLATFAASLGRAFRGVQNGDTQRYAAVMAIAAAVILWTVLGAGGR